MPIDGEYEPSAWNWVARQVDQIEASGGTTGLTLQGKPVVVVTMRGRKSGKVRKAALMRVEHDGAYAAIASKGGAPEHPVWYHNFLAHPEVDLQDGPEKHTYRARVVEGEERAEWWERSVAQFAPYAEYEAKTDREIPVFVLERIED